MGIGETKQKPYNLARIHDGNTLEQMGINQIDKGSTFEQLNLVYIIQKTPF